MIETTNKLNEHQLNQLDELKAVCKKEDGSIPNLYPHILSQSRAFPASALYYEGQKLVGFLSIYFFYDEAVEVALLVHPIMRRKGIARELIKTILPLVQVHNFHSLIFTSPSHRNDSWLLEKKFSYMHSEYYMEREDLNPILDFNQNLVFREATESDIPILCALDALCFPKKQAEVSDRFHNLIEGREYLIMLVLLDNHPIGKAHIRWQNNGATLSDIAILPAKQGKGFGTALIAHCINLALSEGKSQLNLDVETHNQRALNLYTRLGFLVQNACDYWEINIKNILEL